ncbi:MAG: SpaA isopeptide-forming pilin-related protein [Lachnospiraceae bacterium]|nr:SpaA isopeptide-forming pilin-related protein [Lachnospiraceae bacterium]
MNPTATQYNRTGGATPLQIQDTLQKGLQFNLGTVKLYQAKYENSEFVKDDEKPVAVTLSKNNFALNSSGCYVMTLDVPQVEGKDVPMILEYSCYALEKLASADVSNSASLFYDDQEIGKDTQTANIDELSWGKLSTSYRISVIKEDGTVNETTGAVIPVPGVEFALYGSNDDATHSIDETNLVSLGITDADGNVVFGKLDPSAHYWVKEISDEVEGYKVLEEAVEVMAPAASADSNVMEVTMDNDRTTLDGTITIKKQVEDENKYKDAGTFASYWTTFKLQQKLGDGLAPVDVFFKDGAQGSYEYAGAGSQKREDTDRDEIQLKDSFTQTDDSNEINITALPWGEYYLTETAHQVGTATEKIASHFTVNKDGTVTFDTGIGEEGNATGYKGFVDVNDNTATFVNHATDVTITKKGPDGKGGYEPKAGVKFHLYLEKTNDGGKTWTHENFMPLTWNGNIQPDTVFDTDAEGVLTIRGLGKTQENERYHLQEIPESADTYAADYYFTMSEDGVMTNLGNADPDGDATLGEVTVDNTYDPNHLYGSVVDGKTNNNAVTITNKYGQIKIHKQDQDGTALSGVDFKVSGYDSADSEWKQVGETQTTDSNGELYFNNLKVTEKALAEDGTNNLSNSGLYVYKLEETRPANYFDFGTNNTYYFILDQYGNIIEVTVDGNNVVSVPNDKTTDVIEIDRNYMVIRNVYARMDMQLTKSIAPDKTGATSLLPNAKFDLYQVVGNADYTTSDETAESDDVRMNSTKAGGENHISTDNNGKIQLSALSAETYYYNSGKVDLKTGVPVEYLAADGNYQNYQYYWKEVDTDNVYTVNTADGLGYSVTQAEGSATDSGFKPTDTDQKENMLSETAADKYVDFLKDELTNQTLNAYIKFKKIDASDNSAVGGAVYTLKGPGLDAAGVDITTATKATTGHVTNTQGYTFDAAAFEIPIAIGEGFYGNALAEGTYTLEETTPAPGYTRDTTVYTFTVDDAHANLVILDSDGKVNGKNTTDAGKWESLPLSIQKGDPVDGNTLKDNQLRFNLSKLVFGAATETALAGCEFTIEPAFGSAFANVDSDKVHSAITLSDSNYILDKTLIADNTYILKETVAAYGYSKLQYPVVFKAGKDGAITLINGSSTHYYNSDAEGEAVGTTVGTDGTVGSNTVVAKVAPEVANGISTAIMKVYDQPIAIYLTKVGQEYNEESSPSASGDKISAAFSIKGDFYDSKNASVASNQTFESLSSTEWDKKDLATVIGDYKFIIGKTYILEETANADAYVLPNSAGSIQFKILDNGGIEWITDGDTYDPKLAVTTLESSDTQNTAKKDQLTIANYKILGSAELIKKDGTGTSANAVKGAKFKLYSYTGTTPSKAAATDTVVGATNGVNTYLGEYTTDNDGKIKAENLPVGKYFFVESFTPAGYVNAAYTDDTYYKFDIVKDADTPKTGIVPTITTFVKGINTAMDTTIATDKVSQAVNTPITGDNKTTLNLFKYDADDTATSKTGLAGAEFELVWNSPDDYTTSETSKVTLKTDAAGALWACAGEDEKWDDEITLIRGTYTLTETKSPAGYALDNGSGEAFSCQFTVTNDDLGNEIMILPAGTTVEANQKVANYVENSIKNAAALTADGVTNTKVKVDLLKVFSPKSSWAMAQFSITPAKGSTFADGKTESKSLSINSSNGFTQTMNGALVVGNTYIIKEFGTHTCYGALRYPILVKVADDGTLSIVSNIGVEDAEGPITSAVTPSDAGKKGKIGETEVVSIAFDSDEKKNTVSITNKTFEAKLLKAGAANTPLAGAEFTLSGGFVDPTTGGDPENITIPVTVGENGLVLDKDSLVVGEKHYLFEANSESVYTLTETKAPAGYELDRTPITFRFNWIGDITEVQDTNERFQISTGADKITKNVLTFTDEKIDVSFQKQDMSGNAIKNCGTASFTVTGIMANADGTVGAAASSVAFSLDTSKTLPGSISELSGKLIATETTQDATKYVYTLTETTAPHGYQTIPANTGYFTVGTDGTVTVTDESGAAITTNDNLSASGSAITVKDEPIEVTLNKTNASGGAIATGEAIFKITDATTGLPANADHFAGQTSNTVQSIEVTTTNGTIKVSGVLLAGHTYDVTESQAPAGYITRTETLAQIAVAADGTVTVTDKINETDVAGVTVDNTTDAITIADKATAFDVLKVDNAATPTALTGVGLSIFKYVDGKKQEPAVVAEWASGSTAKTITSLEEGVVYGLEETTRLTGYATATPIYFKLEGNVYAGTSKLVQVNADGTKYTGTSSIVESTASGVTNYEIHMTDDKILVPIQVRKVTGTGESAAAVAGATFHIQKKGGTNTDPTWTDLQDTADASLVYHSDNVTVQYPISQK